MSILYGLTRKNDPQKMLMMLVDLFNKENNEMDGVELIHPNEHKRHEKMLVLPYLVNRKETLEYFLNTSGSGVCVTFPHYADNKAELEIVEVIVEAP